MENNDPIWEVVLQKQSRIEREDVFNRHNYQKLLERKGGEESASPLNLI